MILLQHSIHYFFHLIFPIIIAYNYLGDKWKKGAIIFLLTMLVDLDHLIANPVFNPCRCSIGFHLLHSYFAIFIYILMLTHSKTRLIAIGLLMHMATDSIDCGFIKWVCG
jgi:hypothetical protein